MQPHNFGCKLPESLSTNAHRGMLARILDLTWWNLALIRAMTLGCTWGLMLDLSRHGCIHQLQPLLCTCPEIKAGLAAEAACVWHPMAECTRQ